MVVIDKNAWMQVAFTVAFSILSIELARYLRRRDLIRESTRKDALRAESVQIIVYSSAALTDGQIVAQVLNHTFPGIGTITFGSDALSSNQICNVDVARQECVAFSHKVCQEMNHENFSLVFVVTIQRFQILSGHLPLAWVVIENASTGAFSSAITASVYGSRKDLSLDFYNIYHTVALAWESLCNN